MSKHFYVQFPESRSSAEASQKVTQISMQRRRQAPLANQSTAGGKKALKALINSRLSTERLRPANSLPSWAPFKFVMTTIRYFGGRPLFFWLNAVLVGSWLFLLWPLFSPIFFTPIYAVYLTVLVLPALAYAYMALIGGNRINLGLLIASFFVFAIGETYLRLKVTPPEERFSGPIVANGQHPYYGFTGIPNALKQMAPPGGWDKRKRKSCQTQLAWIPH
jgi:hypothetical protein